MFTAIARTAALAIATHLADQASALESQLAVGGLDSQERAELAELAAQLKGTAVELFERMDPTPIPAPFGFIVDVRTCNRLRPATSREWNNYAFHAGSGDRTFHVEFDGAQRLVLCDGDSEPTSEIRAALVVEMGPSEAELYQNAYDAAIADLGTTVRQAHEVAIYLATIEPRKAATARTVARRDWTEERSFTLNKLATHRALAYVGRRPGHPARTRIDMHDPARMRLDMQCGRFMDSVRR